MRFASAPIRLFLTILAAASTLVATEWTARRWLATEPAPPLARPATIHFIAPGGKFLPPLTTSPTLLLIGNSHTYALPGLKKGDLLRDHAFACQPVLIDDLAASLRRADPAASFDCYAIADPNLLPYEMLTQVAYTDQQGFRPNLVLLGLTWRNIARDSQLRPAIREVYNDAKFAGYFRAAIDGPTGAADRGILDAIDMEVRRAAADEDKRRVKSDADRLDEWLADGIGERITLLGSSKSVRAQFRLQVTEPVQNWLLGAIAPERGGHRYEVIEHDLQFNMKCLHALLQLFNRHGATVVCYLAPERTDVPPLMDPVGEEKFVAELNREASASGAVVLDARHVVPNEFWGWSGIWPDDSHFTEPGHERLADFLVTELQRRHLLAGLNGSAPK